MWNRYEVEVIVPFGSYNPLFETKHIQQLSKLYVTSYKAFQELEDVLGTLYRHPKAPGSALLIARRLLSRTSLETCVVLLRNCWLSGGVNEWEACSCCESSSYSVEICSRILDFGKKLCTPSAWMRGFNYTCFLTGSSAHVKDRKSLDQARMPVM